VNPQAYSGTIQSMNRNFKQGIIQQFNLNVERQLPGDVVLTVGYAGRVAPIFSSARWTKTSRTPAPAPTAPIPSSVILSVVILVPPTLSPLPLRPVRPVHLQQQQYRSSRYDSVLIKAETKSARHGLYALFGYTYSRNFDSGLPDGLGTNPGALYWPLPGTSKLDWGLSQLTSTTVSPPASSTISPSARASIGVAAGAAQWTQLLDIGQ